MQYLLGCSLTTKEVFLEGGSCLFKLVQAVLLAFNKAMRVLCFAERAQPLAFWDLVQRRGQAEQVTTPITAITENDLLLMMTSFAELTVECEDVVWNTDAVRRLTCRLRLLRQSEKLRFASVTDQLIYDTSRYSAHGRTTPRDFARFLGGACSCEKLDSPMMAFRISAASSASSRGSLERLFARAPACIGGP